jgi:hypothetical protein
VPQLGKVFLGVFLAVALPVLTLGQWRDLAAAHPMRALALALAWELLLGLVLLGMKIASIPTARRAEQLGESLDLALGRRMSRFGRRYRQWVLDSRRFVETKGLAIVGDFTPELDDVFVDVSLASRAPNQVRDDVLADVPPDVIRRYSVWEFLGNDKPVVLAVIGAPGSGKTTLLSHVARRVAQTPRRRRRPIPVLLQLRDHAGRVALEPQLTPAPTGSGSSPARWMSPTA